MGYRLVSHPRFQEAAAGMKGVSMKAFQRVAALIPLVALAGCSHEGIQIGRAHV